MWWRWGGVRGRGGDRERGLSVMDMGRGDVWRKTRKGEMKVKGGGKWEREMRRVRGRKTGVWWKEGNGRGIRGSGESKREKGGLQWRDGGGGWRGNGKLEGKGWGRGGGRRWRGGRGGNGGRI